MNEMKKMVGDGQEVEKKRKGGGENWIKQKPILNRCQGFLVLVNESHDLKSEHVNTAGSEFPCSRLR